MCLHNIRLKKLTISATNQESQVKSKPDKIVTGYHVIILTPTCQKRKQTRKRMSTLCIFSCTKHYTYTKWVLIRPHVLYTVWVLITVRISCLIRFGSVIPYFRVLQIPLKVNLVSRVSDVWVNSYIYKSNLPHTVTVSC